MRGVHPHRVNAIVRPIPNCNARLPLKGPVLGFRGRVKTAQMKSARLLVMFSGARGGAVRKGSTRFRFALGIRIVDVTDAKVRPGIIPDWPSTNSRRGERNRRSPKTCADGHCPLRRLRGVAAISGDTKQVARVLG
jgi:hypothetical protein